jgi:hypothetical protein
MVSPLTKELDHHGVVVIRDLFSPEQLRGMQKAFALRLRRQRWNDLDGYEKTESYRHMVQDVLTLHQGFVDVALHPRIVEAASEYIGPAFQLVEAKGWLSLPTKKDFHGWHGDAWYDQAKVKELPREVKLGFYLTDVHSGAFKYVKGSHGKQAPRPVRAGEVADVQAEQILEATGPAGTAILFDTTGIHRQGCPILEPRQAVFYCYHDAGIPLQAEDWDYYRYHPLLLNAAFLGGLTAEQQRILGFGDKRNYRENYQRAGEHCGLHRAIQAAHTANLHMARFFARVGRGLRRLISHPPAPSPKEGEGEKSKKTMSAPPPVLLPSPSLGEGTGVRG